MSKLAFTKSFPSIIPIVKIYYSVLQVNKWLFGNNFERTNTGSAAFKFE